jgi:hypothetical protein
MSGSSSPCFRRNDTGADRIGMSPRARLVLWVWVAAILVAYLWQFGPVIRSIVGSRLPGLFG